MSDDNIIRKAHGGGRPVEGNPNPALEAVVVAATDAIRRVLVEHGGHEFVFGFALFTKTPLDGDNANLLTGCISHCHDGETGAVLQPDDPRVVGLGLVAVRELVKELEADANRTPPGHPSLN
jgi:hypothetical protein